jgi:RHS repeat-associated protein
MLGGSLVLKNGKIDKVLFEGGYAQATSSGAADDFAFNYYNTDHLGNVREVVNAAGTVQQVTNYYPFGATYFDDSAVKASDYQPYKYNGKELDKMYGLNTYDYGARQHEPTLARWDRIDPLCEKYYGISPYAYCANNPVKFIDPDGKKVYLFSTSLPGASWVPFATHTFIVVQDSKGNITYAAYGPKNNDAISGHDVLSRCNYSSDIKAYTDYFSENKKSNHVKGVDLIPVPNGMTSDMFDSKVVDAINEFGNDPNIKYNFNPTNEDEGNCNSSSSTILKKAGVSNEVIEDIKDNMKGICWGFSSTPKPWTKTEQKNAVEEESQRRIEENKRLNALLKSL